MLFELAAELAGVADDENARIFGLDLLRESGLSTHAQQSSGKAAVALSRILIGLLAGWPREVVAG